MRQRREAMSGTAAPKGLGKRLSGRMSLLVSALSLMVFFGSAQAASAWHLTSVSPTSGCPGNRSRIHRDIVQRVIDESSVEGPDLAALHALETTAKVTSSTKATGIVPLFSQTEGSGVGTVRSTSATRVAFTYNQLQNCFKGGGGNRRDRRDRRDRPSRSDRSDRPDR